MAGRAAGRRTGRVSGAIGTGFESVFRQIERVRRHRPIHTRGLRLEGTVVVHGPSEPSGIAWIDRPGESPATARVSRSAGTPDGLPDVVGLAVRFHHPGQGTAASTVSDILLATTGWSVPGRFVLLPRLGVSRAPLSTIMPYRGDDGPVLLGARTRGPARLPASLPRFERALGSSSWQLGLFVATPLGPWQRFGTLTLVLAPEAGDTDLRFDAVLHPLPGASTYEWARRLREPSYTLARREPGGD